MSSSTTLAQSVPADLHGPALRILQRLLAGIERPPALRLGAAILHELESHPEYTLVIRDPGLLRRLVLRPDPLLLADAYFRGVIDVEGDLYSALSLKAHFETVSLTWRDKLALWRDALMLRVSEQEGLKPSGGLASRMARRFAHRHSRRTDRAAISFHYDVSNAFYGLWLDRNRVYSCGYFRTADDSLDQAQEQKLDHICRKLALRPGERLLDIGCGWGGLILWAVRNYGVRAVGITLSEGQYRFALARIRELGLTGRCEVRLLDYRDVPEDEPFDKISSVGMFEHVGRRNLPVYFAKLHRLLRPGGLVMNHGITTNSLEGAGLGSGIAEFVDDYVFPGGDLLHLSTVTREMGRQGLEVLDAECLRPHYACTLWHWVDRLEARRVEARAMVGEKTLRVWLVYMAGAAHAFARGWISIYQLLGSRPMADGTLAHPLTRDYMYR